MYCSECGAQLVPNAKFCSECSFPTYEKIHPTGEAAIKKATTYETAPIIEPAVLGIKWLRFWTYVSLPIGSVIGIFLSSRLLGLVAITTFLVSLLQLVVVFGIHSRKIWAWRWNWLIVFISYISVLIPMQGLALGESQDYLIVEFIVKLILGGLLWMWPNHVYWKKRRELFS